MLRCPMPQVNAVTAWMVNMGVKVVQYLPYSPDLAPSERSKFRRRRGVDHPKNVVDFLVNGTSGIGERSTVDFPFVPGFDAGHVDDPLGQNTNIEELTLKDYSNNRDFNSDDYSDTHTDTVDIRRKETAKIAGGTINDPVHENEFDFQYPDYHWDLLAVNSNNSKISSDIESFSTALEDISLKEERLLNRSHHDPKLNFQPANQLLTTEKNLFEDSQQFPSQENSFEGPDWILKSIERVSTEDERANNTFPEQPASEIPTSTQTLMHSSEAHQGCQIITTVPPVDECGNNEKPPEPGVHLVTLRWREVGIYFTITAFVIFAGFGKLVFHKMHWLSSRVPESCLLIVLGVLMGLLVHFAGG
ncbi:hypothetical protein FHG87_004711 [Trinorchestia longiramus]|nr:hypothetical protein FHG87_004711 [Trinorchestia longiramus]